MTAAASSGRYGLNAPTILAALAGIVIVVALATPEAPGNQQGGRSSYSTAPGGVRITFDLAQRMGWRAERRVAPLDTNPSQPTIQVVLAPNQALGAHEVHRLLANVRRGGGLIFALDGGDEIADSLGVASGRPGRFLSGYGDSRCPTPQTFSERTLLAIPPEVHQIVWRKPAPGLTTPLVSTNERMDASFPVGVGFPMGVGRVAVVSTSAVFANDAIRICAWGADVAVARVLEYVQMAGGAASHPVLVFDEFHHGFGTHGGGLRAVAQYLGSTSSGHFLAQGLLAGFVLVLATAPRAIAPRDPQRIVRRSPLEHADALGHAYADVGAARTAAARLVSGLRRRAGRSGGGGGGGGSGLGRHSLDDDAFLDSVAQRFPALAAPVAVLRRALHDAVTTPAGELVAVGDAVRTIEQHLTASPPIRS